MGSFPESFLGSVAVLAYVTDRSDDRARITSLCYMLKIKCSRHPTGHPIRRPTLQRQINEMFFLLYTGAPSIRKFHVLRNRRHVITKDSEDRVTVWDVLKVRVFTQFLFSLFLPFFFVEKSLVKSNHLLKKHY